MPGPNTLGPGSGHYGLRRSQGDFSWAGVVTRVTTAPPTDADWGDTPPENGTIVFEGDGVLWVRLGGIWKSAVLF